MRYAVTRWLLASPYIAAGVLHLALPRPFVSITPSWVPAPSLVVAVTGVAEILGAAALVQGWSKRLRRAGGVALALYAVCVFPANINHFIQDMARPDGGLGLAYHIPRMFAQPALVWLALWSANVIAWPFGKLATRS